jgi:hypothetical protein
MIISTKGAAFMVRLRLGLALAMVMAISLNSNADDTGDWFDKHEGELVDL